MNHAIDCPMGEDCVCGAEKWNGETLPSTYDERKEFEFFTTEPSLALKTCERVSEVISPPAFILEPSAGSGAFVRAARLVWKTPGTEITAVEPLMAARELLREAGADEVSSFKIQQFVELAPERVERADLIIGNPPFTQAEEHIRLLMKLMKPGAHIAFLLRIGFYGAADRQPFWAEFPERWMFPVSPRPSFLGEHGKGKTDGQEYAVFLWEKCATPEEQAGIHPRRGPLIIWEKPKQPRKPRKPRAPKEPVTAPAGAAPAEAAPATAPAPAVELPIIDLE